MLKKRTKVLWQVAMKEATKNDYDSEENNIEEIKSTQVDQIKKLKIYIQGCEKLFFYSIYSVDMSLVNISKLIITKPTPCKKY